MKKIALCFIISYDNILNKENIWREWIDYNKDIMNVYFYYKDLKKIKSSWILKHTIPVENIFPTSYYHVIPAYISLFNYAYNHDKSNQWFCILTDSCCPIVSPTYFRHLFETNSNNSIMSWRKCWWNVYFHKRANLALVPEDLRLGNDPWFVLKREHVKIIMGFFQRYPKLVKIICDGGLANESIFAIIFKHQNVLGEIINSSCNVSDWSRMENATSPHLFKNCDSRDIQFIEKSLNENAYAMFLRKVDPSFPDNALNYYIYNYFKERDCKLKKRKMFAILIIFVFLFFAALLLSRIFKI